MGRFSLGRFGSWAVLVVSPSNKAASIRWLPDTSATRHFGPARDTSAPVPKCLMDTSVPVPKCPDTSAPILWCRSVLWPKCPAPLRSHQGRRDEGCMCMLNYCLEWDKWVLTNLSQELTYPRSDSSLYLSRRNGRDRDCGWCNSGITVYIPS